MSHLTPELKEKLEKVAKEIVADGKGILAADESNPTVGKRFADIKLENNQENRRLFRQMLFSCPEIEKFLGGVIFFEETFDQKDDSGKLFREVLSEKGIKVGIKVDKGLSNIPGTAEEKFTKGFDDLIERTKSFADRGAHFAKWRCVLTINEAKSTPSPVSYFETANTLAKYALICQENGLVPIVEPEVLIDGDHDINTAMRVTEEALSQVYRALKVYGVHLEGTLLKPNMVTPGQSCSVKCSPEVVAKSTLKVLKRQVPPAVPGITFLSGGQSEKNATIHLNAMNALCEKKPWALTFSFARALQNTTVKQWEGKKENLEKAHNILRNRLFFNSLASRGKYNESEDTDEGATGTLFVANHTY